MINQRYVLFMVWWLYSAYLLCTCTTRVCRSVLIEIKMSSFFILLIFIIFLIKNYKLQSLPPLEATLCFIMDLCNLLIIIWYPVYTQETTQYRLPSSGFVYFASFAHLSGSVCVKDVAWSNISSIFETFWTFQFPIGWLKDVAI